MRELFMMDRFPTESDFQADLPREFFPLISVFQLSMHLRTLHQINARNAHVAEQSTCPGLLAGENYIGVGTMFEA